MGLIVRRPETPSTEVAVRPPKSLNLTRTLIAINTNLQRVGLEVIDYIELIERGSFTYARLVARGHSLGHGFAKLNPDDKLREERFGIPLDPTLGIRYAVHRAVQDYIDNQRRRGWTPPAREKKRKELPTHEGKRPRS